MLHRKMLEMYLFPSSASLNKVLLAAFKYESAHLKHLKHLYLPDIRIFVFSCAVYVTAVGLPTLGSSYIPYQPFFSLTNHSFMNTI